MCGIAGIIAKKPLPEECYEAFILSSKLMNHRGPDFCGQERIGNVLLIHYRLSILDLDPRSHQPFHSADKNLSCIYNGELYNFKDLKNQYQVNTHTSSDTEILVETFAKKGTDAVPEWNGIFATAIHDKAKNKLHLIRDRYGVKPLYIYQDDSVILFASEAKVIYDYLPALQIDYDGLAEYMWYGNTVTQRTIIKGVQKVAPAGIIEIDLTTNEILYTGLFWKNPGTINGDVKLKEASQQVTHLLEKAVQRQLMADVPLGVLLSGGIDSSAIVAFASKNADKKLDTYTVEYDYNIGGENELGRAALVAKKYNTNHHELKIEAKNITDTFTKLVFQYDEPFADAANIPLYELAKVCSLDKKVILQGDGGDEFFGGYRTYNVLDWLWFWKPVSKLSYRFLPDKRWAQRMERMAFALNQKSNAERMALLMTQDVTYQSPYTILSKRAQQRMEITDPFNPYYVMEEKFKDEPLVQKMLYADVEILLPHTFLEKVDKATMLCGVEARVPFLDNELTGYVLGLPASLKVRNGEKKYLLKKALKDIVPEEILSGKKKGFDVPYKEWLRKDLYDLAQQSFSNLDSNALFDKTELLKLLDQHKNRVTDVGNLLWKALVIITWFKIYENKITV